MFITTAEGGDAAKRKNDENLPRVFSYFKRTGVDANLEVEIRTGPK